MNNIVSMVNYYLTHKNADISVIEYIKKKLDNSSIEDLIIIQIELLFTDPSDKLVSSLVSYINNIINNVLKNISLSDLANLISTLHEKQNNIKIKIDDLDKTNEYLYDKIKTKDLNNDNKFDNEDSLIASNIINDIENNKFLINNLKSEDRSINIWLNNLDNSFNNKLFNTDIISLLECYIIELNLINKNVYINKYINLISKRIDDIMLNSNLISTITNVMPEIDKVYNDNSKKNNELFKLLDYYIDLVDSNIKKRINVLDYEEKLILKDKLNAICYDILNNETKDDDFKALVINSYIRYL